MGRHTSSSCCKIATALTDPCMGLRITTIAPRCNGAALPFQRGAGILVGVTPLEMVEKLSSSPCLELLGVLALGRTISSLKSVHSEHSYTVSLTAVQVVTAIWLTLEISPDYRPGRLSPDHVRTLSEPLHGKIPQRDTSGFGERSDGAVRRKPARFFDTAVHRHLPF